MCVYIYMCSFNFIEVQQFVCVIRYCAYTKTDLLSSQDNTFDVQPTVDLALNSLCM